MELASEETRLIRRAKDVPVRSKFDDPREDKDIELEVVNLNSEIEVEDAAEVFEKNMMLLLPKLHKKAKKAGDRLKPWMKKQIVALPLDYQNFKLLTNLMSRPELKSKVTQLASLPHFTKSFVDFSEKVADLYEAIMSNDFLEEIVWACMEALIAEQNRFREHAIAVGKQIPQLLEHVEGVYDKRANDTTATKAFMCAPLVSRFPSGERSSRMAICPYQSKSAGGTVGGVGITLMILGVVLAPFTAGVSVPLAAGP